MKNIDYLQIGERVRCQRELLGYTREQLAEKLNVSVKFTSDIELGVKGFSLKTLTKLSDALHVSTDYILFGADKTDTSYIARLCNECPKDYVEDLCGIVRHFINAVKRLHK